MKFLKTLLVALLAALVFSFAGCAGPKFSATEGKTAMEDTGYEVVEMTEAELSEYMNGISVGASVALRCTRESTKDALIALWFDNEILAKVFETAFQAAEEEISKKAAEEGFTMQAKTNGAIFYYGTAQACADFATIPPSANSAD